MYELLTLSIFILILAVFVATGQSLIIALSLGLLIFVIYAFIKGNNPKRIGSMILNGVKSAKTILIVFGLIGILTALWRAGGTIPFLIYHSIRFIRPDFFVLYAFILCSMVSILTGTSFGTASTMGVVCMSIGLALGIDPFLTGGAILSGVFFGDRCSAISSSALLVSELTQTNLFINIKNMLKTTMVPLLITMIVYAVTGHINSTTVVSSESVFIYSDSFNLYWWVSIPAALVILLSLFKFKVKRTLIISIIASVFVCIYAQKISVPEIISIAIMGYEAENPTLGPIINGGGLVSMVRSASIVGISSSYFGIFRNTEILLEIKRWIRNLSLRTTSFFAIFLSSILMSAVSCNQTLATMLTFELNDDLVPDRYKLAIYLENTVIVIAPLIPWSIAGAFPLTTVGAPASSILYAVYLYILPLYGLLTERDKPNS
ncbi:Na+/H+ antiporter NhaC family protein [Gudongella oleilytica]|uniref:Na+/H+ antiporter NhaC family protein n=1 Tax=Gudongella oleilytica TaxID=1582259 RepID=UPI002A372239|nr:Na+/H+ antiporter NhaC family protein [Gudongella oleilytica]MDY0256909.1 Na+/H+ antiporter NhaC family protein [Gudongella oleilytica]